MPSHKNDSEETGAGYGREILTFYGADPREMSLYSISQAAHYLKIAPATLHSWVKGRKMLTTYEALLVLEGRGVAVAYSTLMLWLNSGKFPGAERDESHPRGAVWRIPETAVKNFQPPKKGRPTSKKGGKNA
jgi:hypothetical protein